MRSVRLPILVPHLDGSARISSAIECLLRFRGTLVAVVRATPSGVQAITVLASSRPGAGCVIRLCRADHQVPRSRSSSGRQRRGCPSPLVRSGSSVWLGGDCRCRRGRAARLLHLNRRASFETGHSSPQSLYCGVPSAYGWGTMRQPNYALERTVLKPRNHRRDRAAAQRER